MKTRNNHRKEKKREKGKHRKTMRGGDMFKCKTLKEYIDNYYKKCKGKGITINDNNITNLRDEITDKIKNTTNSDKNVNIPTINEVLYHMSSEQLSKLFNSEDAVNSILVENLFQITNIAITTDEVSFINAFVRIFDGKENDDSDYRIGNNSILAARENICKFLNVDNLEKMLAGIKDRQFSIKNFIYKKDRNSVPVSEIKKSQMMTDNAMNAFLLGLFEAKRDTGIWTVVLKHTQTKYIINLLENKTVYDAYNDIKTEESNHFYRQFVNALNTYYTAGQTYKNKYNDLLNDIAFYPDEKTIDLNNTITWGKKMEWAESVDNFNSAMNLGKFKHGDVVQKIEHYNDGSKLNELILRFREKSDNAKQTILKVILSNDTLQKL